MEKTRTISLTWKARNGRRMGESAAITEAEATDPAARAAMLTRFQAADARRLINWKII